MLDWLLYKVPMSDLAKSSKCFTIVEEEEETFVWEEFLEQVGCTAVPPSAFKHVRYFVSSNIR